MEAREVTHDEVIRAIRLMAGFARPWWVAGGWALDLWLAAALTRPHDDVEFGLFRADQEALREHLAGWAFHTSAERPDGRREWVPCPAGGPLEPPAFQLMARRAPAVPVPRPPAELHFFLEDTVDGEWVFRRNPQVRLPPSHLTVMTAQGVRVLAPEIQLLHKARHHRPKDEHDFAHVHHHLSPTQRAWLRAALEQAHPGDPWTAQLTDPAV